MEQNNFKCSGDCMNCHPSQRAYCASQFTYNTMRMVENMQQTILTMQGSMEDMNVKIEALQEEKVEVFDPTKKGKTTITQDGDGVKE